MTKFEIFLNEMLKNNYYSYYYYYYYYYYIQLIF